MTSPVERLAKKIREVSPFLLGDFISHAIAQMIVRKGWIHKSQAVEYVEFCKNCSGKGRFEGLDDLECDDCHGKGIVLKKGD